MTISDLNRKDPYGRLLRKEDIPKDSEHFSLQEYSWLEFSPEGIVFTDNPRSSLIIKALHDPKELAEKVRIPGQFNKRLRKPLKPLLPVDLSDDYRKFMAESIQRRKRRNFDDDDTTTIDFSEISTPPDLEDRLSKWKSKVTQEAKSRAKASHSAANRDDSIADVDDRELNEKSEMSLSSAATNVEGGLTAQQDLNSDRESRQHSAATTPHHPNVGMRPASDISQAARDRILAQLNAKTGIIDDQNGKRADFKNIDELGTSGDSDLGRTEQRLNHDFNSSNDGLDDELITTQKLNDAGIANEDDGARESDNNNSDVIEKNRQQAYQSGYNEATRKFGELHEALSSAASEIQELKQHMLLEGRDIFVEILSLTAEEIIRKKLSLSDDAISRVFQSAVSNLSKGGPLRVKANLATLTKLRSLYSEANLPFESLDWQTDDSLPDGDLKLQAMNEAAKVDLKSIVSKKVQALAQEIFSTADQSSKGDGDVEVGEDSGQQIQRKDEVG